MSAVSVSTYDYGINLDLDRILSAVQRAMIDPGDYASSEQMVLDEFDTYGNDTYDLADGDLLIDDRGGVDTITSTISRDLADHPTIENLILLGTNSISGTGNALDNVITGNDGNNILDGRTGQDTLIGGFGNDTYVLGADNDTVVEGANGGWDTITSTISRDFNDYPEIENLTLLGRRQHQRDRQQMVEHTDRQ